MSASIEQIWNIVASRPKFVFSPTFIFCSPICSNNCGVVFLWKYILVFEKWLFSFDRSNMQIFTVNITRVVWPHVTNLLDLRYFCRHNPLFYHLNLIPCHYWSCKEIFNFWWIFLSVKRNKKSEKKQKEWPTTRRTITEINKPKAAKFLCVSFHDWYLIPVTPRFLCRKVASKQRQF